MTMPWKKAFMLGQASGDLAPAFQMLKQAGFEGVELLAPNEFTTEDVLKARDAAAITIHGVSGSVHWAKPLSDPNPAVVDEGIAAITRAIADARDYGASTVLVVPAVVTRDVNHRQAEERSRAAIQKLIPLAEQAGITLAIENVWNRFLLSAPEFARYIDSFNSPAVRAYFDVGNVVEFGFPQEWIRELGKRIAKIHIKEYARPKRFDYKLGEGEIDWSAVKQALRDVGYEGWITAEVPMGDLANLQDVAARMQKLLWD
jgi:hexulose-6-phosphate isomerase